MKHTFNIFDFLYTFTLCVAFIVNMPFSAKKPGKAKVTMTKLAFHLML